MFVSTPHHLLLPPQPLPFFFWQLLASNKTFSFEHSCWNIYHVYFSRKSILNRTMDALITSGWSLTLKCRPRMTKDSKSFAIFYSTGVLDTSMSKHVQINLPFSWPSGSGRILGNFRHRTSPLRTAWPTYKESYSSENYFKPLVLWFLPIFRPSRSQHHGV